MNIEETINYGNNINRILYNGSIIHRIVIYTPFYFFMTIIIFIIGGIKGHPVFFDFLFPLSYLYDKVFSSFNIYIAWLDCSIWPLILFWLKDKNIQKYRKKNNLPLWKNIESILIQRKLENNIEENSLDYWFKLKQKGAITEEEYNIKKEKLLKI
ncbi:SHOCT domain-containing protein [Aliarcobacter butzleri]